MRGLDLRKFKKVRADDNFTTMVHEDGHEIKVAHKPLSKARRSQLESLPMASGGEVPGKGDKGPWVDPEAAKAIEAGFTGQKSSPKSTTNRGEGYTSKPVNSPSKDPDAEKRDSIERQKAKFNSQIAQPVQNFDVGGMAYSEPKDVDYSSLPAEPAQDTPIPAIDLPDPVHPSVANEQFAKEHPVLDRLGLNGKMFGGPGMGDTTTAELYGVPTSGGMGAASSVQASSPGPNGAEPTIPSNTDMPETAPEMRAPAAPAPETASEMPVPAQPAAGPTQGDKLISAFDKQTADQAKVLQQGVKEQNKLIMDAHDTYQATKEEYAHFINDLQNQHVDPDRLWNSKSDAGRAATIIGIMLAGFSPVARPNAAIEELDKAIDRDIDSQKAELGKKQTLLSMNMQHFKDLNQAIEMTRVMQMGATNEKLKVAAAKAGDPVAKAKMLEDITKYDAAIQARVDKVAQQKALSQAMDVAKKDPSKAQAVAEAVRRADPKTGEELAERATPFGFASTKEGGKAVREASSANEKTQSGIKRLLEISKTPYKSLSPTLRAEADTIQAEMMGPMRTIQGLGTLSESDKKLLENMIRNPTSLFSLDSTNKKALETLSSRMNTGVESLARANGLNPPQAPKESQYQTMGGVKYMKVPGGWTKAK